MSEESLGHSGAENGFTLTDRLDGAPDGCMLGSLDEVPPSTGPHGGEDRAIVLEHGQHQYGEGGAGADDTTGGVDAMKVRELEVHDDDVRLLGVGHSDGLLAGSDAANHGEATVAHE